MSSAAAERLVDLTTDRTPADFERDRNRRDALLWNFTVLGEAVAHAQCSEEPLERAATRSARRHSAATAPRL